MSLKFVPPKSEKLPRYASYGAGQMKTHASIGAAKQSLAHRCKPYWSRESWKEGFILELIDGEWWIRYHVAEGTMDEDLPWYKDAWKRKTFSPYYNGISFTKPWREEDYTKIRMNRPETKEEYAEFRVKVALEKAGITE